MDVRPLTTILAEMTAEKNKVPDLAPLNTSSSAGVMGWLMKFFATLVQNQELAAGRLMADLDLALAQQQVGTLAWYRDQVLAYQFGDVVGVVNGRVGYATLKTDPNVRVVRQCSVTEQGGRLLVKTRPQPGKGATLTAEQLQGLRDYLAKIKYAGTIVDVVSIPRDELRLQATIRYDRQVMTGDGKRISNPLSVPYAEGLITYLDQMNFDSVLNWNELTAFMNRWPGIVDYHLERSWIRAAGASQWTEFTRETPTRAGWLEPDLFATLTATIYV